MPDFDRSKPLAPGVYEVGRELHIDADELCAHHGVPVTPGNVQTILDATLRFAAEHGIPEVEMRVGRDA